jgi:hypothetical protein
MKKMSRLVLCSLIAGMLTFWVVPVMAGEHGGQENDGSAVTEMSDEVKILMQAAEELKATNPELSKKLEDLAKEHQS